jgi:hypothetical protein
VSNSKVGNRYALDLVVTGNLHEAFIFINVDHLGRSVTFSKDNIVAFVELTAANLRKRQRRTCVVIEMDKIS